MKKELITPGTTMREFGVGETWVLLRSAAKAIRKAREDPSEEAVHKMRVSIRRLQQALRIFGQFLRGKGVRAVRRELKSIMVPAGELRNCDIALTLTTSRGPVAAVLRYRRQVASTALTTAVSAVVGQGSVEDRWSRRLELPSLDEEDAGG
jgi:CHAD domain-containing protein